MPTVQCGQRITAAKLVISGVGYGKLANAKKNAYRNAINRVRFFLGRERMRWRCESRCPGTVQWRQRVRYGRPAPRPNNTVRITCKLTLRLIVDCPEAGGLAKLQHQFVGGFSSKKDATQSQASAVPPAGGGKSGVSFAGKKFAATFNQKKGYYYIIYMPELFAEEDPLDGGDAATLSSADETDVPEEFLEDAVFEGFSVDLITDDDP